MNRICKRLSVLLLLAAMLLAIAASAAGTAEAVDLDRSCNLTVKALKDHTDLHATSLTADLYLVAEAKSVAGSDSITYTPYGAYGELDLWDNMDTEGWQRLAQEAASIALNPNAPDDPTKIAWGEGGIIRVTGLQAGLYLLLVHASDADHYTGTMQDESGAEMIVTTVTTAQTIYKMAPVLIALPAKEADGGAWLSSVSVTLKAEATDRFGSLEIKKSLMRLQYGSDTFVFQVEAVLGGRTVYSNVFSMTFSQAGTQSLVLENIPIGAEVTVTEVYSGAHCRLLSEGEQTTVIGEGETACVEFTNDWDDTKPTTGGGIDNYFEALGDGRWNWTQRPFSP